MSVIKKWYVERAVSKVGESEVTDVVDTSRKELKRRQEIENTMTQVIQASVLIAEQPGGPLLLIPTNTSVPDSSYEDYLKYIEKKADEATPVFGDDGEILHFVLKYPIKEVLTEEFKNKYPKFSKEAFLTEILLSDDFRHSLFAKTMTEFVEFEREKIEKVGKFLVDEPVEIQALDIKISPDYQKPVVQEGVTSLPPDQQAQIEKIKQSFKNQMAPLEEQIKVIQDQIIDNNVLIDANTKIANSNDPLDGGPGTILIAPPEDTGDPLLVGENQAPVFGPQEEDEGAPPEPPTPIQQPSEITYTEQEIQEAENNIIALKQANTQLEFELVPLVQQKELLQLEEEAQLAAALSDFQAQGPQIALSGNKAIPARYIGLLHEIETKSEFFITSKFFATTGDKDLGALIMFQGFMIIPPETTKKLQEVRNAACLPQNPKENQRKPDDRTAERKTRENRGTNTYQDSDSINSYKLSAAQKATILQRVQARIQKVPDANFVNMLINADKIKTIEDVFTFVYNIIPVEQILIIAAECLQSLIPDIDVKICQQIMDTLNDETLQQIIKYTGLNLSQDAIARDFKNLVLNEFMSEVYEPGEQAFKDYAAPEIPLSEAIPPSLYPQLKNFLVEQYNKNATTKNVICALIFAAVPAAITLLVLFLKEQDVGIFKGGLNAEGKCDDSLNPSEEKLKAILLNPVENFLTQAENSIKNHPILSFTQNFVDNIIDQFILFIEQGCIYGVTTLVKAIAQICEDTEQSDYAGAPANSPIRDNNNNPELVTDPEVFGELFDFINISNPGAIEVFEITDELLKRFIRAIGELLTISELCLIFNGNPGSQQYNSAFDKIWYGLLSTTEFSPIKQALRNKDTLVLFLNVFGDKFNDSLCNDKISELTKAKKLLNEICESNPNEALIQDLSDKLASSAIEQLLAEEEKLFNDLIKSMKDLIDPANPEVFCGPEADAKGETPLIDNFLDPSTVRTSRQTLLSLLQSSEKTFETEVSSFNGILTTSTLAGEAGAFPGLDQIFGNGYLIAQNQKALYGFQPGVGGTDDFESDIGALTSSFNALVDKNNIVAINTLDALQAAGSTLLTNVRQTDTGPIVTISLTNISLGQDSEDTAGVGGELVYAMNFSQEVASGLTAEIETYVGPDGEPLTSDELLENSAFVEPQKSKFIFLRPDQFSSNRLITGVSTDLPLFSLQDINNAFLANSNLLGNNDYDVKIKDVLGSTEFYASILEQIIKEHAEYMVNQDLFKRSVFDKLKFVKQFACDVSLFDYKSIVGSFDEYSENAKKIACADGFGKTPTPLEKLNIYYTYEAYVLLITISEMLKSLFSFTAFGLEALLPETENVFDTAQSLYLKYLITQIEEKSFGINPPALDQNATTVVLDVYSILYDKDRTEISLENANIDIVSKSIRKIQSTLYKKLNQAGIPTKMIDSNALIGDFAAEFQNTDNVKAAEVLKNIVAVDPDYLYGPPIISVVDLDTGFININPDGNNYSTSPRLLNGGFFIEQGIEILHSTKGSTNISIDYLKDLATNAGSELKGFSFPNSANPIIALDKFIEEIFDYTKETSRYAFGSFASKDTDFPKLQELLEELQGSLEGLPKVQNYTAENFYNAYRQLGKSISDFETTYDFFEALEEFLPMVLSNKSQEILVPLIQFFDYGRFAFGLAFSNGKNINELGIAKPAFLRNKDFIASSIAEVFLDITGFVGSEDAFDKLMTSGEISSLLTNEGYLSYENSSYTDGYLSFFSAFKAVPSEDSDTSTFMTTQDYLNAYLISLNDNALYPEGAPEGKVTLIPTDFLLDVFDQTFNYNENDYPALIAKKTQIIKQAFPGIPNTKDDVESFQYEGPILQNVISAFIGDLPKQAEKPLGLKKGRELYDNMIPGQDIIVAVAGATASPDTKASGAAKAIILRHFYRKKIVDIGFKIEVSIKNKPRIGLTSINPLLKGDPYDNYITFDMLQTDPTETFQFIPSAVLERAGFTVPLAHAIKLHYFSGLLSDTAGQPILESILNEPNLKQAIVPIGGPNFLSGIKSKLGPVLFERNFDVALSKFNSYKKSNPIVLENLSPAFANLYGVGYDHPWFTNVLINPKFFQKYGVFFYVNPGFESYNPLFDNMKYIPPGMETFKLKIAMALLTNVYTAIKPPENDNFFIEFIESYIRYTEEYGGQNSPEFDKLIKSSNYFEKINHYKTLNILLPFEEIEEVFGYNPFEYNNAMFTSEEDEDLKSRRALLFRSAMERKFLIKEQNGKKYFKFPLVKIDNIKELPEKINQMIEVLKPEIADQDQLLLQFAQSSQFKTLVSSLDYKNILSLVAILIKETIEAAYPKVNNIFDTTNIVLRGAGANLQNVANRGNLSNQANILQASNFETQISSPSQSDLDKAAEVLKGFVKAIANMTDPTWQTPWLLPGPLTPFGFLAKALEPRDDDESDTDAKKAANKNKPNPETVAKSLSDENCPPEEQRPKTTPPPSPNLAIIAGAASQEFIPLPTPVLNIDPELITNEESE